MRAAMAQLVEHILGKDEVPGSNPGSSSKKALLIRGVLFWCYPRIRSVRANSEGVRICDQEKTTECCFLARLTTQEGETLALWQARSLPSRAGAGEGRRLCGGCGSSKHSSFEGCFFGNEAHLRCMKNEAGLRPLKRAFGTRRGLRALCFMRAQRVLHVNIVDASYLLGKCLI